MALCVLLKTEQKCGKTARFLGGEEEDGERRRRRRWRESYTLHKEPVECISPTRSRIRFLAHNAKQRAEGLWKLWSWGKLRKNSTFLVISLWQAQDSRYVQEGVQFYFSSGWNYQPKSGRSQTETTIMGTLITAELFREICENQSAVAAAVFIIRNRMRPWALVWRFICKQWTQNLRSQLNNRR